jgi:hypothetical protein
MGVVWVAEHAMLGRRAALKVLHAENIFLVRDPEVPDGGIDRQLITNDTATPIPRLVALTSGLDATFALADVLTERPAIPRDPPWLDGRALDLGGA